MSAPQPIGGVRLNRRQWDGDPESIRAEAARVDDLPLFAAPPAPTAGRARAEQAFELRRADVLEALRSAALRIHRETRRPVSANDIRHVLGELGYTGDLRILGAVFTAKAWRPVAAVPTETGRRAEFGATRQTILSYVPKAEEDTAA